MPFNPPWKQGLALVLVTVAGLVGFGWLVSEILREIVPQPALSAILSQLFDLFLLYILLRVMAALGITALFARSFSRRVEKLRSLALRYAEGDDRPVVIDAQQDELTSLARALNIAIEKRSAMLRDLAETSNRSAAILRGMIEGVAVIDSAERIIFCNRAFAEIMGAGESECQGRPLLEVTRQAGLVEAARQALRGTSFSGEVVIGTIAPRSFTVAAAPIPASIGSAPEADLSSAAPRSAVVVLHDITELRRLERVRRDFVANVSHEFKTPLTAIRGFAETLLAGALEDPANNQRFVEIIRDHSVRLARLTDDLLMLARIEAGKLELQFHAVHAADIANACLETTLPKARQKNISVEVAIPEDFPPLWGDDSGLSEVLQNLLDNAIHYTPPGGRIFLTAEIESGHALFTLTDTGIGIPQAEHEHIFERFYRVDSARSREAGGTGLGLSIARHILESHGGRIWVESVVGQGSTFHFTVPLAPRDY